ncbi:DNA polymerase III subunit delta, partial [Francisellaceae bacterium]|nr:DNA polymerase III subunit delta [Francisellaceae bacterium]
MKIPFLGLKSYLDKKIYPVYLITGDEPYQIDYSYRSILKKVNDNNIEVEKLFFENSVDAEQIYADQSNLSLFSELKMVALLFNKVPDKKSQSILNDIFSNLTTKTDKIYLIRCPKLNKATQNMAWYKKVEEQGLVIQIWEPNNIKDSYQVLNFMLQDLKITADPEASQLIIEKTEGNLFSAAQLLQMLYTTFSLKHITLQDIEKYIESTSQYTIYDLISAWLSDNKNRVNSILTYLKYQNIELNLIIWNIARSIRILVKLHQTDANNRFDFFKKNKIFKMQQSLYLNALASISKKQLYSKLIQLAELDELIKTNKDISQSW